jgi:hypothetical protein
LVLALVAAAVAVRAMTFSPSGPGQSTPAAVTVDMNSALAGADAFPSSLAGSSPSQGVGDGSEAGSEADGADRPVGATRLLTADFESTPLPGRADGGTWATTLDGSTVLAQTAATAPSARWTDGTASWRDYEVSVRVRIGAVRSGGSVGLLGRVTGDAAFDRLLILPSGKVQLQSVSGRTVRVVATSATRLVPGDWVTLTLHEAGAVVTGLVDGYPVGSGPSAAGSGAVALATRLATAHFDGLQVIAVPA